MTDTVTHLRRDAQQEASRFPALLARAEHLAGTVLLGEHGRRRSANKNSCVRIMTLPAWSGVPHGNSCAFELIGLMVVGAQLFN